MSDVVNFPGEYLTQEQREQNRWVNVAFCACAIAGRNAEKQRPFLRQLLNTNFADIPDQAPPEEDVQAYAAYAVQKLLIVLTEDPEAMKEIHDRIRVGLMDMLSGKEPPDLPGDRP
jgi:hypothetical protein